MKNMYLLIALFLASFGVMLPQQPTSTLIIDVVGGAIAGSLFAYSNLNTNEAST